MNTTSSFFSSTIRTRLIQFTFALLLMFTGLASTGCSVVDNNEPDRVISVEPELTVEDVPEDTSDGTQDDGEDDLGTPSTNPYIDSGEGVPDPANEKGN